ncbi:MAG: ABC transporter permease [Polyangiales bacterium]
MIPVKYNVRSLTVRKATSVATALGIALVVFVLSSSLMLSAGIKKTLATGGRDDTAIVLRKGSDNELSSTIETSTVSLILAGPGAQFGAGEIIVVAAMEKIGAIGVTNVQLRGVSEASQKLRPEIKVVEGRAPQPGKDEVMVGRRLRGRFKGLELGQTFELRKNRPATVVGIFEAGGSSLESEVWVDLDTLRTAYARLGIVSSVRVKLSSAGAFDAFKATMESDKQYGFLAMRETEYLEKQSEGTATFIGVLGTLISVFFSIGAMIGAMITMYAAVANRQREIGTLRALGFSRRSILASFLLESVTLALVGGVVGAGASMMMGFVKFSMMNFASWSEIVFSFEPTPRVIVSALVFAGAMGLFGGFFPAIRAARVSPIKAIRG